MNEFVAKKLGEVLAFSNIGIELFERGETVLKEAFSDYDNIKESFSKQGEEIGVTVEEAGVSDITLSKSLATGNKLRGMMETYIGDEWDNLAELLEWMGFFEGAAVIHWKLVEGVAEALDDENLLNLAKAGISVHHDLFHTAQGLIKEVGGNRAKES